jgi:arginyl-tRNA synthetase
VKEHLRELVAQSLLDLRRHGKLPQDLVVPDYVIERTKSREHGDYATNIALLLAKAAGLPPRELAQQLVANFGETQHVSKVEIAGPGFINFKISQPCRLATLRRVFEQGAAYGRQEPDTRESVTVEFVSANPNGPLHVGHGRGAP